MAIYTDSCSEPFFVDGGFAGPNRLGAWEHAVFCAEAHLACAALAREARGGTFVEQVQELTGQADDVLMPVPVPPPPLDREWEPPDVDAIRRHEYHAVGWRVFEMQKRLGDDAAIATIAAWADAPAPKLHKL